MEFPAGVHKLYLVQKIPQIITFFWSCGVGLLFGILPKLMHKIFIHHSASDDS